MTRVCLFLIIIVFWLNEADRFATFCLRWFSLEFCQSGADGVKLGTGALVYVILIRKVSPFQLLEFQFGILENPIPLLLIET